MAHGDPMGGLEGAGLDELRVLAASLIVRVDELERLVSDHAQRFDTLQTPLWRRVLFRLDGWPGVRDLNAPARAWRPWHRRAR